MVFVWVIDHCFPIPSFNLLDENEMEEYFGWINLRPMHVKQNNSKKTRNDHQFSVLQQIEAEHFTNLNEQEL